MVEKRSQSKISVKEKGGMEWNKIWMRSSPFLLSILPRHSLILSASPLSARKDVQKFRELRQKTFLLDRPLNISSTSNRIALSSLTSAHPVHHLQIQMVQQRFYFSENAFIDFSLLPLAMWSQTFHVQSDNSLQEISASKCQALLTTKEWMWTGYGCLVRKLTELWIYLFAIITPLHNTPLLIWFNSSTFF